jgi:O-antigen/teichoic acid export membrane protein
MMPMFISDADIGQYATAYRILEALLILPAVIATAAFPVMIRTVHSDFSRYQGTAGKSMQYSLMIAGPVVGILFVFAKPIIVLVFGKTFISASYLLQILVWGLFFQSVNNTLGRSMIAANLEKFFIPLSGLALMSNVLLNLYLLPRIGVVGAAIATLGSYAFSTLIHIFVVWNNDVLPEYRNSLLTMLSFVVAGVVTLVFYRIGVGYSSIVFGGFTYLACLFGLKVMSFQQIRRFRSVLLPKTKR